MAYEVFLHLVYLLTSIDLFKAIEIYYTGSVLLNLILFMAQIKVILVSSSTFLHALMNILILHFCDLINRIFLLIEGKLIFYLYSVHQNMFVDYFDLAFDIESYNKRLLELHLLVDRYIHILETARFLSKVLKERITYNLKLIHLISKIRNIEQIIVKLYRTFSYQNSKIVKIITSLSPINLEKYIKSRGRINDVLSDLKKDLEKLNKHSSDIINMDINISTNIEFQKGVNAINDILKRMDLSNRVVSNEINPIIGQIFKIKEINLFKLYKLISDIQPKYFDILIRGHLLVWTIEFYQEIEQIIRELLNLMKFDSCNPKEFLGRCLEVEKNGQSLSDKIDNCIIKLAKVSNRCNIKRVKELNEVLLKLVGVISVLKFYVDLIAREILIFKMIILNLIFMASSSFILDELISVISENITKVEDAIARLMAVDVYLRTFYVIQLENILSIVGLSSALKFSQYIHGYYDVLVINLQLINGLIWVIECYIHHLLVFMYVTKGLNSLIEDIGGQVKIITNIYKVISSLATISNKLNSINKSIKQLNDIQSRMDITKWNQTAAKIRDQTQSVSKDIEQINSQITEIRGFVRSILSSWPKLVSVYYFLLLLMDFVYLAIENTNNSYRLGIGIQSPYFRGLIMNIVGPCNKQLKFIFWYLIDMWLCVGNLIKIVEGTIVMIHAKMALLSGLNSKLQTNIDEINKGVEGVECAIEGVPRNFIRCSVLSLEKHVITSNDHNFPVNEVLGMYSVFNVMDYNILVNRLLPCAKNIDQILQLTIKVYMCRCIYRLQWIGMDLSSLKVKNIMDKIAKDELDGFLKLDKIREITRLGMSGNHMCLCMVIKYLLYPQIINIIQILASDLQTLSTLSRKFTNYTQTTPEGFQILKILILVIDILDSISKWVNKNYYVEWTAMTDGFEIECYCKYYRHRRYYKVISIILFLSSLIENLWSMDHETTRMSIERLSTLMSELDKIDSQNNKPVCNNNMYSLLVNKECKAEGAKKCCCCWCSTAVNVLVMCISLSFQCKLFNALCTKKEEVCKKVKQFCEVDKCECQCTQEPKNGVCCLLKLALSAQLSCTSGELQKKLEKCCPSCSRENGCCKKLLEKAKGLCKLLLLGCECSFTEGADSQVKGKIVTLKNPYSDKSVPVVVFCKCGDPAAKGCCLYQLIENLKKKSLFDKICQEDKCVCDDLKNLEEICGTDCSTNCAEGCPCKDLKGKLDEICNGRGKCGGGDCLCKQIPKLKECCLGKKECECSTKEGLCKCVCCKVLGATVRILTRSCRANVLEPYKRITLELINCGKDKPRLARSIVKGINETRLNNIYLVKNNSGHGTSLDNSITDLKGVRNWGYDTHYEHQVTTNIFSNVYPNYLSKSFLRDSLVYQILI